MIGDLPRKKLELGGVTRQLAQRNFDQQLWERVCGIVCGEFEERMIIKSGTRDKTRYKQVQTREAE
jgi:hypothetical protein